jgi:hypothetical protein
MTCHMQIWVGAFVLDALGPRGSHAVRAHLTICEACRDDVVSLWLASGMRGLLDADEPVAPSTQRHAAPEVRRCVNSSRHCPPAKLSPKITAPMTTGAKRTTSRITPPGVRRSGSALCGILGFQQHLSLWLPMLGGIGWIIASDNAGYLLRRRFGARLAKLRSEWQPRTSLRRRVRTSLHAMTGDPRAGSAVSYRMFALVNGAHAVVWGSAFVGMGYLFMACWDSAPPDWTRRAASLTAVAVTLSARLFAGRRRTRPRGPQQA